MQQRTEQSAEVKTIIQTGQVGAQVILEEKYLVCAVHEGESRHFSIMILDATTHTHLSTIQKLQDCNYGKTTDNKLICLHSDSTLRVWDVCSNPRAPKCETQLPYKLPELLAVVGITPTSFITIHTKKDVNQIWHWEIPSKEAKTSYKPELLHELKCEFISTNKIIFLKQKQKILFLANEPRAIYSLNISDDFSLNKVFLDESVFVILEDFFSSQDENMLYVFSKGPLGGPYLSCWDTNTLTSVFEKTLLKESGSQFGICVVPLDERAFAVVDAQQVVVYQCAETAPPKHCFTIHIDRCSEVHSVIMDAHGGLLIAEIENIIRVVPDQKKLAAEKTSPKLSAIVADALPSISRDVCGIITNYALSHSLLFNTLHRPFPADCQVHKTQPETKERAVTLRRNPKT